MLKPDEERWLEERQKVIEEWSDIELRFPDGPPTSQTSLPGSVHPTRPGSAGTANGHYFCDPDPLLEEILNEDYSEEMKAVASTMTPVQPSTIDILVSRCLCRPKPHLESHSLKRERNLLVALSTAESMVIGTVAVAILGDKCSHLIDKFRRTPMHYNNFYFTEIVRMQELFVHSENLSYCNASTSQWALLRSFYSSIAAMVPDHSISVSECPRKGSHWQAVGFQGSDPATDFRGTGILGLIQLYCMAKNLPEGKLAEIVHLSRKEPHDFPLAVVGINITAILITKLRNGELLESAVTTGGYLKAMNKLYQSCILLFCKQWREENCTVKDCQQILNRLALLLRNSQQTLLNSS